MFALLNAAKRTHKLNFFQSGYVASYRVRGMHAFANEKLMAIDFHSRFSYSWIIVSALDRHVFLIKGYIILQHVNTNVTKVKFLVTSISPICGTRFNRAANNIQIISSYLNANTFDFNCYTTIMRLKHYKLQQEKIQNKWR